MKTVKAEKPSWIPDEDWELAGYAFEVEDQMSAAQRRPIRRRANVIGLRQARLSMDGVSIYEDMEGQEMMETQWLACRQYIRGIHHDGRELSPAERVEFLDQINFVTCDCLSNEVVGANLISVKKK